MSTPEKTVEGLLASVQPNRNIQKDTGQAAAAAPIPAAAASSADSRGAASSAGGAPATSSAGAVRGAGASAGGAPATASAGSTAAASSAGGASAGSAAEQGEESIERLRARAEAGDANAQCALGKRLIASTKVAQKNEGGGWLSKAADQNNPEAQYVLGKLFIDGLAGPNYIPMGINLVKRAAAQVHLLAVTEIGLRCLDGEWGIKQDKDKGIRHLNFAATRGCAIAQYHLGVCYKLGNGVTADGGAALSWFRLAADQGEEKAQLQFAGLCLKIEGTIATASSEDDKQKALRFLDALMRQQNPQALFMSGMYQMQIGKQDEGINLVKRAAKLGDPAAKQVYSQIDSILSGSKEVTRPVTVALNIRTIPQTSAVASATAATVTPAVASNKSRATQAMRDDTSAAAAAAGGATAAAPVAAAAAAKNGEDGIELDTIDVLKTKAQARAVNPQADEAEANFQRASSLLDSVRSDSKPRATSEVMTPKASASAMREGMTLMKQAAQQGNSKAQAFLGITYTLGANGVKKDEREGLRLVRLSAEQLYPRAIRELAIRCIDGKWGVKKSEVRKIEYLTFAANRGDVVAQLNLGLAFKLGKGVAKDKEAAFLWCRRAAAQGYADAKLEVAKLCLNLDSPAEERAAAPVSGAHRQEGLALLQELEHKNHADALVYHGLYWMNEGRDVAWGMDLMVKAEKIGHPLATAMLLFKNQVPAGTPIPVLVNPDMEADQVGVTIIPAVDERAVDERAASGKAKKPKKGK